MKINLILILFISCSKLYNLDNNLQKLNIKRYNSHLIINYIELEDVDYFVTMIQVNKLSPNDFLTIDAKFLKERDLNIDFRYLIIEQDYNIKISILGYSILRNKVRIVEALLKESYDRHIENIFKVNGSSFINCFVASVLTKNYEMIKIVFKNRGKRVQLENYLDQIIKLIKSEEGLVEILEYLSEEGLLYFNENVSELIEISFIDVEEIRKKSISSSLSIAIEKKFLRIIKFLLILKRDLNKKENFNCFKDLFDLKKLCKIADLEIVKILARKIDPKEILANIIKSIEEAYNSGELSTYYIINLNNIVKYLIDKGATLKTISLEFILKKRLRVFDLRNILNEKNIIGHSNSKIESFFNFIYMNQETQQIEIFLDIEFELLSLINRYNLSKIDNIEFKRQLKELACSKIEPLMKPLISKSISYLKSLNHSFSLQEIFEVIKIYDFTKTVIKILEKNSLEDFSKILEKEDIKLSRLLLVDIEKGNELKETSFLDLICLYNSLDILKLLIKRKESFRDFMILPSFLIAQKLIYLKEKYIKVLDLIIENSFIDEKIMEEIKIIDINSFNHILKRLKFQRKQSNKNF